MDGPFKLLVYAIFAMALLAVFYFIIWPLLAPASGAAELALNLKASETALGKGISKQLFFQQGEGFSGQTFDTGNRSVSFQCNSAELCCPREEECSLAIEWGNRLMKFNESRRIMSTTRCDYDNGLYVCRIYFGNKPAQIEIDSLKMETEFDLAKENALFEIKVSNTGGIQAENTEVVVEISRVSTEHGLIVETPAPEYAKTLAIGAIKAGESATQKIPLEINENGGFKAKIRAMGADAGFEEKTKEFSTIGAGNNCRPYYCEDQRFIEGKCTARCHCSQCFLGSDCAEQILSSEPLDLGLYNVSFENAEATPIGSNVADIILEDAKCPLEEDGTPYEPTMYPDEPVADPKDVPS